MEHNKLQSKEVEEKETLLLINSVNTLNYLSLMFHRVMVI